MIEVFHCLITTIFITKREATRVIGSKENQTVTRLVDYLAAGNDPIFTAAVLAGLVRLVKR